MALSAFSGLLMENTTRGQGWRFLDIGRRMERALQMGELLRAGLATAPDGQIEANLQVLLRIADSSITYRSRYLTVLRTDLVLELLLADESNPRSVGFQLAALYDHLTQLPQREEPGRPSRERCHLLKVLTAVRLAQVADLSGRMAKAVSERWKTFCPSRCRHARPVGCADRGYLSHTTPSRMWLSL